jgi:predicted transcriptional regulator
VKLRNIVQLVGGSVLTKQTDLETEIVSCGASDLMSDVLSYMKPGSLLLTGLVNLQSIRTAEMADLAGVVFVRGKTPSADIIELADDVGIPLIAAPYSMYELCGRLFQAGLPPTMK